MHRTTPHIKEHGMQQNPGQNIQRNNQTEESRMWIHHRLGSRGNQIRREKPKIAIDSCGTYLVWTGVESGLGKTRFWKLGQPYTILYKGSASLNKGKLQ